MVQKFKSLIIALIAIVLVIPAQAQEEKEEGFTFGGAVRYNIISTSYESEPTTLNTEATWDTWRLNVDGSKAGVDLSFEYRFYPTFGTHFIHHGYLGYNLSDDLYMKLGVLQKPFGITKYASHSWWFQGQYYVGLEDDYDMGIGFDYALGDKGEIQLAYFRQEEPGGPYEAGGSLSNGDWGSYGVSYGNAGPGRYSYDITAGNNYSAGGYDYKESIRELNTVNARVAYEVIDGLEIGGSAQVGGIYNDYLEKAEIGTAFAGHVVADFAGFNLKAQYTNYNYAAKGVKVDPTGNEDDEIYDLGTVQMGAYGSNYPVTSNASIYTAGLAYSIPVEFGPISNIQPYLDFTMIDKPDEIKMMGQKVKAMDTYHLVPGFLVTAGSIYTYVDFALGKNQPWLTENFGTGLGQGRTWQYAADPDEMEQYYYTDDMDKVGEPVELKDMPWNLRFNINIGYYF